MITVVYPWTHEPVHMQLIVIEDKYKTYPHARCGDEPSPASIPGFHLNIYKTVVYKH